MPASRQLRNALRFQRGDRQKLATALYESKRDTYVDTLRDLAESYGYDVPTDVKLGRDVEAALRDEATDHARLIADTYNRELGDFLDRNGDEPYDRLIELYETWADERMEHKAEQIAVSEAYSAYTDATLSLFAENELEPEFDFGGHGDDAPACKVCEALAATSPHPLSRVREVGIPHIGCRQNWHPLIEPDQLPDELHIGGIVGGVLGADPLVNTEGGHDEAVAAIERLIAD